MTSCCTYEMCINDDFVYVENRVKQIAFVIAVDCAKIYYGVFR